MLKVFNRVFSQKRYTFLGLVTTVVIVSAVLLIPNYDLMKQVIVSGSLSPGDKLMFIVGLYKIACTNFTAWSLFLMVSLATLSGVNIALLTYYIRRRQVNSAKYSGHHVTSLVGLVSGIFGIGCAACGSIIIISILSFFGASSILLWLPLRGAEFSLIGIALLLFSNYLLLKKIDDPLVCAM